MATANLGLTLINGSDLVSPEPINTAFKTLDALGLDYIVASGKSGEWWYRKWKSGRAECGIDAKNFGDLQHNIAWNSMYRCATKTFGAYPFSFAAVPCAKVAFLGTSTGSQISYVCQGNNNSTTQSPSFFIVDCVADTAKGCTFGITVNGRYK